jgi:hypothetical protein
MKWFLFNPTHLVEKERIYNCFHGGLLLTEMCRHQRKVSAFKKLTCKGTLRKVFIRVYIL